jgi:hypothetical protein
MDLYKIEIIIVVKVRRRGSESSRFIEGGPYGRRLGHFEAPRPAQVRAIGAPLGGSTVTDAAKSAGVSRATVHRWLSEDPDFMAAYNMARREATEALRQRLRGMGLEAVEGALLTDRDTPPTVRLRAAMEVLEVATSPPGGPTDPRDAATLIRRRENARAAVMITTSRNLGT